MPIDQPVLGFTNRWYGMAAERAVEFKLTEGVVIRIPTAPVFLATKWEAFEGRGEGDMIGSHDLENLITVVAGRPEIPEELAGESKKLRQWLATKASEFLKNADSAYALQGALPELVAMPDLMAKVQGRFQVIASSG